MAALRAADLSKLNAKTRLGALRAALTSKCAGTASLLLDSSLTALLNRGPRAETAKKQSDDDVRALVAAIVEGTCGVEGSNTGASVDTKADTKIADAVERATAAIADVRAGKFVIVQDAESRENEGDLIIAAEKVTPDAMAFMVNYTSGIICVGMPESYAERLALPQMVARNTEAHGTAFTVTVDLKEGTTTGISAEDRSKTIRALANPKTRPENLCRPGHIFPLRARAGGVLERPGHTETSVDLARLAGLAPLGAMCEITNRDGSMARTPHLRKFARQFGIRMITIADLMAYRRAKESPAAGASQ